MLFSIQNFLFLVSLTSVPKAPVSMTHKNILLKTNPLSKLIINLSKSWSIWSSSLFIIVVYVRIQYQYPIRVEVQNTAFLENLRYVYINTKYILKKSYYHVLEIYFFFLSNVSTIFIKNEKDSWNIINNQNILRYFSTANTFLLYPSSKSKKKKMSIDRCVQYEYPIPIHAYAYSIQVLHRFKKSTHVS
jgi:hypothetical protein